MAADRVTTRGPRGATLERFVIGFGVFLLGYMVVSVGRPVTLAIKSAAEAAATRARSAVQSTSAVMDLSSISTEELEQALHERKKTGRSGIGYRAAPVTSATLGRPESSEPADPPPKPPSLLQMDDLKQQQQAAVPLAQEAPRRSPSLSIGEDALAASMFPRGEPPSVNPSDYKISKEMVKRIAKDNMVMVTWANFHYLDFTINWVYHVKKLGIENYMVGAMDNKMLNALVACGINTFSMQSGLSTNDFGWGSPTFHKMGREKINLIVLFTDMGVDLLLSDVDTVWSRNPMPYILKYPDADVLTSSDHLSNTVPDESLEKWPNAASAANIGIMFFRAKTAGARQLAKDWSKALDKNPQYWDQNAFNDLFRKGPHKPLKRHLFKAYDSKINLGILPVSIFASGHTYFVQRLADRLGMTPYVVHATFQFSGTPGKRHRFREALMWLDPPEYFDRPGGFITFDMDIPPDMLKNSGPSPSSIKKEGTVGHFTLVHHQILQIRSAFALGLLLGRAVVIPQLWCGLDRWWAPHAGTIPGSKFKLPFPCPLDHVLDLEQMIRPVPHFGPTLEWREHSFLQNPRLPQHVNESRVEVVACAEGEGGCSDGSSAAQPRNGVVRLLKGLNEKQIAAALEPFKDKKFIHFSSLLGVFGGFEESSSAQAFEERTKHYTSLWCCSHAHPGHIWYDMWFDKVPRRDRHNRQWTAKWAPKTGP